MPFVSDNELGDDDFGMPLIQSDLQDGYAEAYQAVANPASSSPVAGPSIVGFGNEADDVDMSPAPVAPMDIDDDEEEVDFPPPATTQKTRGRASMGGRSNASTPARTTIAKTPKTGKSTVASNKTTGRKRKVAEVEEEKEDGKVQVEQPSTKKRGRSTRTTGVAASARLAALAAKKPTRGRPKSTTATAEKTGRAKKAVSDDDEAPVSDDDEVPENEYEVEAIVESAIDADTLEHMYLVKWKGYPESQNTWEPRKHLDHAAGLIKSFDAKAKKAEQKPAAKPKAAAAPKKAATAPKKAATAPREKKKPGRKPGRPGRPKRTKA